MDEKDVTPRLGQMVLWNFTHAQKDDWTPAIVVGVRPQCLKLRIVSNSPYAMTNLLSAVRFWKDAGNNARNTQEGVWRHTDSTLELEALKASHAQALEKIALLSELFDAPAKA